MFQEKVCPQCNQLKYLSDFHKDKSSKYGTKAKCKKCVNANGTKYRRTKTGLISHIYSHQRSTSRRRKMDMPKYTKQEFVEWILSKSIFHKLYINWKESKYEKMLSPSVDRIDDYKNYSFDNIQLMTWEENLKKAITDIKSGKNNKTCKAVTQYDLKGIKIKEYHSISAAQKETKTAHSCISECCNNKRKTANGFIWKFN